MTSRVESSVAAPIAIGWAVVTGAFAYAWLPSYWAGSFIWHANEQAVAVFLPLILIVALALIPATAEAAMVMALGAASGLMMLAPYGLFLAVIASALGALNTGGLAIVFILMQVGFVIVMFREGIAKRAFAEPLLSLTFIATGCASLFGTMLVVKASDGPRETRPREITPAEVAAHDALGFKNKRAAMRSELFGRAACALTVHARSGSWPTEQSLADCPGVRHDSAAAVAWGIAYHPSRDASGRVTGFRVGARADSAGTPLAYTIDASGMLFRTDYHRPVLDTLQTISMAPRLSELGQCWLTFRETYGRPPGNVREAGDSAYFAVGMREKNSCSWVHEDRSTREPRVQRANVATDVDGYRFEYEAGQAHRGVVAIARPIEFGITAIRSYRLGTDGQLRATTENRAATDSDSLAKW
ncbi:MAG: hypothetical protein JWM95_1500 [Gemmatimonadetes bacterium]|nr:hypothetical protein [Gemmatimonadota bacterium]